MIYFLRIESTKCDKQFWVLISFWSITLAKLHNESKYSPAGAMAWLVRLPIALGPYISPRILSWTKIFFCNLMTRARNRASPEMYTFLKNKEYKQTSLIFIWRKSFLQVCTKYEKITFEPERGWCYLVAWRWEQFWNISKIASILCHKSRTTLKEKSENVIWWFFFFSDVQVHCRLQDIGKFPRQDHLDNFCLIIPK